MSIHGSEMKKNESKTSQEIYVVIWSGTDGKKRFQGIACAFTTGAAAHRHATARARILPGNDYQVDRILLYLPIPRRTTSLVKRLAALGNKR